MKNILLTENVPESNKGNSIAKLSNLKYLSLYYVYCEFNNCTFNTGTSLIFIIYIPHSDYQLKRN